MGVNSGLQAKLYSSPRFSLRVGEDLVIWFRLGPPVPWFKSLHSPSYGVWKLVATSILDPQNRHPSLAKLNECASHSNGASQDSPMTGLFRKTGLTLSPKLLNPKPLNP